MFKIQNAPQKRQIDAATWRWLAIAILSFTFTVAWFLALMIPGTFPEMSTACALMALWSIIFGGMLFVVSVQQVHRYDKVQPENFAAVMASATATPEGKAYREQVLAQGREFTNGDWNTLHQWAKSAPQRAARKSLYNVSN